MPVSRIPQSPVWPGGGVFAWHPECGHCTWVWYGGRFKLKFASAVCRLHACYINPEVRA